MRTHQHHHLPAWGVALAVSGMLALTAGLGFVLAMSGLAAWIFVLIAASAAVAGWIEGRPAARARVEAATLPGSEVDAAEAGRFTQLFSA